MSEATVTAPREVRQRLLLRTSDVRAGYGRVVAVDGVSFEIAAGETVSVVGPNGAGKTTLLKVLGGVHAAVAGSVELDAVTVTGWSARARAQAGLAHVPEGAQSFATMTVQENLEVPLLALGRPVTPSSFDAVFEVLPILAERRTQAAGTLSGGELRMLSIARGLVVKPQVLLVDEPTLGLAPAAAHAVAEVLDELHGTGLAILISEQNLAFAEEVSDRAILLQRGRIQWTGSASEMRSAPEVAQALLGRGLERLAHELSASEELS